MTLSDILALLSLSGFAALIGQAIWKTWLAQKDQWGLYKHDIEKMPEVISWALRHCLNRGFIVIADRNSHHFIQFRKYILRNGETGLELGFPEADWSRTYFSDLRDRLTADGTSFRETREDGGDVTAFIHVDCGRDINMAVGLARLCLFDIFALTPDTLFRSSPSHYSTVYDCVEDPDYENPTGYNDWWTMFRARERGKGRPDPSLVFKIALFFVAWLICYVTLAVTWGVTNQPVPEWEWEIGPVDLAGSHSSWILIMIYFATVFEVWRLSRKSASETNPMSRTLIARACVLFSIFGLPLGVVISWLGY